MVFAVEWTDDSNSNLASDLGTDPRGRRSAELPGSRPSDETDFPLAGTAAHDLGDGAALIREAVGGAAQS